MHPSDDAQSGTRPANQRSRWRFVRDRLLEFLVVLLVLCGLFLLIWPACSGLRQAALNKRSSDNLKVIGLAIHRFDEANGELSTNTFAPDGTMLLSWRVHILPQLGADDLYRQFRLDEPWDSANNLPLLGEMPKVYVNPRDSRQAPGMTIYRGFSSPGSVFEKRPPRNVLAPLLGGGAIDVKTRFRLANFRDPLDETLLVVEAAEPVEWTRPEDLDASPGKPFPPLLTRGRVPRTTALAADGSFRSFNTNAPGTTLQALVTHSGGEALPANWDK